MKRLDTEWNRWLQENLDRKCDPESLLSILMSNGFSIDSIRLHMGLLFPAGSPLLLDIESALLSTDIDYSAIARCRLTRFDSGLAVQQVLTTKLQLYILDDFMNGDECNRMIEISSKHLRPSTVTTGDRDEGYRTSTTSDLGLLEDPYIQGLDERIARTLGIRLPYSESIQAQRYERGQEFKQHTDYFAPGTEEYDAYAGYRGQRTWTFMVYLNEGVTGGGTRFFAIDKTFIPRKGTAIVWNNLTGDGHPNLHTLHSGLPVKTGHKIIITKWFRERGNGPMFFAD
jgi:prolyl 4-hydroxylase